MGIVSARQRPDQEKHPLLGPPSLTAPMPLPPSGPLVGLPGQFHIPTYCVPEPKLFAGSGSLMALKWILNGLEVGSVAGSVTMISFRDREKKAEQFELFTGESFIFR